MDVVRREGKTAFFLQIIWICCLAVLGVALGQNLIGWALTAFVAFLIFPAFWNRRAVLGRRTFTGTRTIVAVLFSIMMGYAAWTNESAQLPFAQSDTQRVVAAELRDPSSAEFRNIIEGTSTVCGEVNGKNAFGAYAGFKPFVSANGLVRFEPEQPAISDTQSLTGYYSALAEFSRARKQCYE